MTSSMENVSRPRLSVAMIVRNEQELLAESIESVRSIADEIVVLDTGSTDQTLAVARRLGAVTVEMPWSDDFSAARNRCLTQVTGDWILWLDAGERLDEHSATLLREFIHEEADPGKVYALLVQVPAADPAASGEQIAGLRLMPNDPQLRFEGRVRETLEPSIEAAGLEIDALAGRIIRHRRQHDPARKALRAQRDLSLAALEMAESDGAPPVRVRLAIGDANCDLGAAAEARKAFLAALEVAEHGSREMLEAYYGMLTTYDDDKFLVELQVTTCLEALETFPFDTQLLLAMGNYLQAKGKLDLAARSFDTAVKYGQVDLGTWHLTELAEVAADCLSLTLQAQEQDDEARQVLEEALGRHEDSIRLQRRLIDLHVKHGRCEAAIDRADRMAAPPEGREPLHNALRGACKGADEDWTPALAYLQSAYVAGCSDPICLRWLAVTLLSNAQIEAAEPVLLDWQKVEPANIELQAYLAALKQQKAAASQPATEPAATDLPADDSTGRRLRIDQGTSTFEAVPLELPIVSQTSSADCR